ncbi:AAA ATPase [Coelomomyces lativittatus]|nr:AAA ATPase [Coelomomyces lativittatus]
MNLSTSQAIYQTLYKRLQKNEVKKFISSKDIEVKLNRLKVPLTIVLDEIDQLFTTHSNLLQNVFQWSLKPKVALIGIANSLDLTDRLLPSLSLHHCTPISVTFPAYTSSTLHTILHSYFPHFSTSVLQFVATKVSATSSDVRHALTVCQHAERVAGDATQVTVSHVAQVITPASPWVQALKKLSWSAQLALLSAVSKLPLSIVTWHHQYHRLATTLGMPTISLSELKDIGMHLETLSLLHVRPSKVVLMVPPKEIVRALTTASVIEKVPTTAHELFQQILSTFNEL